MRGRPPPTPPALEEVGDTLISVASEEDFDLSFLGGD